LTKVVLADVLQLLEAALFVHAKSGRIMPKDVT
jgi:hypothetical protein